MLEKVPAAFAENEEVKALKEHVETVAKTAVGKKFIDFTLNTPEGKPVKLSDFIAANNYTLIDFWASWCGPCQKVLPLVDEIARERDDIKVCKVNVDEQKDLAMKFRVLSIPTLAVFKNGELVSRSTGAKPKEEILEMI